MRGPSVACRQVLATCCAVSLAFAPVQGAQRAGRPASARPSKWIASRLVLGNFTTLISGSRGLYSVALSDGAEDVVRVSISLRRVVARSAMFQRVGGLVTLEAGVWALTYKRNKVALLELNASSLAIDGKVGLPVRTESEGAIGPIVAQGKYAWLALGCRLVEVDLDSHVVVRAVRTRLGRLGGTLCVTGLAVNAGVVYVAGTRSSSGRLVLEALSSSSGRFIARVSLPAPPDGVSLASANNYLWAAGGDPGANGRLYLYKTQPLRLVGESGRTGRTQIQHLPVMSQFPEVNASGRSVWVGSDGLDACFSTRTGKVLAVGMPSPVVVAGDFVVSDQRVFALGVAGGKGAILAVKAPGACLRGP